MIDRDPNSDIERFFKKNLTLDLAMLNDAQRSEGSIFLGGSAAEFVRPDDRFEPRDIGTVVFNWGDPRAREVFAILLEHIEVPSEHVLPFVPVTIIDDQIWHLTLQDKDWDPEALPGCIEIPFTMSYDDKILQDAFSQMGPGGKAIVGEVGSRYVSFGMGMNMESSEGVSGDGGADLVSEKSGSFEEEIDMNKNATEVSDHVAMLTTPESSLGVRHRGAYITKAQLTSPTSGKRIDILFSEDKITKPKITATHPMMPAGPYDGIGGQHGFPRWSDYHEFILPDGPRGQKNMSLQAKRLDNGLALAKTFELSGSALTTCTTIMSSEEKTEHTSMGEHLYFSLEDENTKGLLINGKSLDELLGDGSEGILKNDGTLYWDFGGEAVIEFPAGHSIKLSAAFEGDTQHALALWIWKRPDSPSICFEPVVGVSGENRTGMAIVPFGRADLTTKIELL